MLAAEGWRTRIFASSLHFRYWLAQVVSAMGNGIGFLAVAAASWVGGGTPETAVGRVVSARVAPGSFLEPVAGVLVDRWDRKPVMVVCDLGRAGGLAVLPSTATVGQLPVASLLPEVSTLPRSPAKGASARTLSSGARSAAGSTT